MERDITALDDFNFDDDCTREETLKELQKLHDYMREKFERIEKMISQLELVNKNEVPKGKAGRKKVRMYYENRLIHDSDLLHLTDEMGLTPADIVNDFFYVDSQNFKEDNRKKCLGLIRSRIYNARRNML